MTTFLSKHNWSEINLKIFKLQRIIAIAWIREDYKEVSRFQRQLIISFEARLLAVRRVITNPGSKTPGIDGIVWSTEEDFNNAVKDLLNLADYAAKPVKRVWIPKPGTSDKRPLGIPTMFDRAVQALLYIALLPISESRADKRSFGFRPYRSARDVVTYIYLVLPNKFKPKTWILEADIEKCFDRISHEWLINNVPLPKHLLKEVLKSGFMDNNEIFNTDIGTPQGGIISPTLANYCLDGIEKLIPEDPKCILVRYADDFVVVSPERNVLEEVVIPRLENFLKERGLAMKKTKTRIVHIDTGFDFLGFNFRTYINYKSVVLKKVLLIIPSSKNIRNFKKNIRTLTRKYFSANPAFLIFKLNPLIRGWSNYFNCAVSSVIFRKLSRFIWVLIYRWLRRKYPLISRRKLFTKFFTTIKGNKFVFTAKDWKNSSWFLYQIGYVKIVRYLICKLDKNVFTIDDNELSKLQKSSIPGLTETNRKLWNKQKGLCPVCSTSLLNEPILDVHHILPKKDGGKITFNNLILLHRNCHIIVHTTKDIKMLKYFYKNNILKTN